MKSIIQFFLISSFIFGSHFSFAQSAEDRIIQHKDKSSLSWDKVKGQAVFHDILDTEIQSIKKNHKMVEKFFYQNPSSDPEICKEQIKNLIEESWEAAKDPKEMAKLIGKIGVDAFVDLFTSLGTREVNKMRQAKYDVIIEALTQACFPDYEPYVSHYNFNERFLFYSLQEKLKSLSNKKKYYLRAFIITGPNFSMRTYPSSKQAFNDHMQDYSIFQYNLKGRFQQSKYRYRD